MQQQIELIKLAEQTSNPNLNDYVSNPGHPFCIDTDAGGKVDANSNGSCTICVNSSQTPVGFADSSGVCLMGAPSMLLSLKYDSATYIFTANAIWSAPNGTGQDNSTIYYKLASGSILGPSKTLSITFEVMTNVDAAFPGAGLGPTLRACVNGTICKSQNYSANVDPPCPSSPAPRTGTYLSTSSPVPQGINTDYLDIKEECGTHTITIDYGSLVGPINNLTLEFVAPTDYNGYRPPHTMSDPYSGDYHEDSNFLIKSIVIPGSTAHFVSYPPSSFYTLPPPGGSIGPYVLYENWEGVATFNVTTP